MRLVFISVAAVGILLLPLSLNAAGAARADINFEELDIYILAQMGKHGIKGVSLAVTQGEETIYLKGYGTAGNGRAMTPQTPMYIGSTSKSITALAVAQLAQAGKVDVAAPVRRYIPEFRIADADASEKITVSHLLHHTSGLSESGFVVNLPESAGREEVVRALRSAKLTQPVGQTFQYFNVGYAVLAVVIEKASGQAYEDYIQKHIFAPLEMSRTYTDPALAAENGLSQGYSRFFGFAVPRSQPHREYELSAGYLISTAEDMAHFAIAMNNQGEYKGSRLLDSVTLNRMLAPYQGYGWGWFISPGRIHHGGANETFKTFFNLYPDRKTGIVLLINQGYTLDHYISAEQLFSGVERIVLGQTPPPVSQGLSVRWIGWALLVLVIGLFVLQTRNFLALRNWRERARGWTSAKRTWDVAVSFLIPTAILAILIWQLSAFYSYRFNLAYQFRVLFTMLPDIGVLCVIGTVPDYLQGVIKLVWSVTGKQHN